jgi:hypothetical protein
MLPLAAQGVDVVVGTPGRIKDLMARGRLKLDAIRWGPSASGGQGRCGEGTSWVQSGQLGASAVHDRQAGFTAVASATSTLGGCVKRRGLVHGRMCRLVDKVDFSTNAAVIERVDSANFVVSLLVLLTLECRYRVLDEVDRMMAMGFIEDVETILKAEEGHQVCA